MEIIDLFVGFEVLMVVIIEITFWGVMPRNMVDLNERLTGTCCSCLQAVLKMEAAGSLKD
jgi:hypothetical protein